MIYQNIKDIFMNRNSKNAFLRKKLRRIWSIPIVRIISVLLGIAIVAVSLISVFNKNAEPAEESLLTDISEAESANIPESVPEEVSEEPVIALPTPWRFTGADNLNSVIASDYGIIINATTRQVLGGKNYTQRIYPASMTKIMTLIVAVQSGIDINTEYLMDYRLINKYYLAGASMSGILAGDTVTFKDLLYGAVLLSAADATAAIAEMVAGSEEEYVKLMNSTAAEIGCSDSHFTNTSGLYDTANYSTLGDIALMLDYAMSIPLAREILSTADYTTPPTDKNPEGYYFFSTMFTRIDHDSIPGMTVLGGKTGYLAETKHCLASMAVGDNGEKFIVVTAGGAKYDPIDDCIDLYTRYYGESSETRQSETVR